jgi:fucose 4-O-acetylase-like acetyltransferase
MTIVTLSRAAYAQSALTLASLALGIVLLLQAGGPASFPLGHALPLLALAQSLKLLSAIALGLCVAGVPLSLQRPGATLLGLTCGVAAVLTMAGAALAGAYAILAARPTLATPIAWLGFSSLALTGVWVLTILSTRALSFGRVTRIAGLLFAASAILALLVPMVGLLAAVAGIGWWAMLGWAARTPDRDKP